MQNNITREANLRFRKFLSKGVYSWTRPHEGDVLECDNWPWKEAQGSGVFCEVTENSGRIEETHLKRRKKLYSTYGEGHHK